jgi:hypothetical protein
MNINLTEIKKVLDNGIKALSVKEKENHTSYPNHLKYEEAIKTMKLKSKQIKEIIDNGNFITYITFKIYDYESSKKEKILDYLKEVPSTSKVVLENLIVCSENNKLITAFEASFTIKEANIFINTFTKKIWEINESYCKINITQSNQLKYIIEYKTTKNKKLKKNSF